MENLRHGRRILLFFAAIAVPCLVLVALGLRMVRQDRELTEKRAAEDQRRLINQIRQDALNKLDQIKLRAAAGQNPTEAVLVAPLPWRDTSAPALPRSDEIERGEQAEFAARNPQLAEEHYRRALDTARDPAHAAYARLLLARAMTKAGQTAAATSEWRALLATPLELADDQGVPYCLYAAERLKALPPGIFGRLAALPPTALYLLKNVTDDPRITESIARAERVEALINELPALEARYAIEEVWAPFGDPPWLVSAAKALNGGSLILVAVRASDVLPPLAADGIELGSAFPGVKIRTPRLEAPPSQHSLLYAALILVVALTLFGSYLLWRDIRREVALSEMRSQFVSSVSHELKTPLTAIRMFAETLRMRRDSDPRMHAEYLDTIISESERLSRLVDNVLDFSKIERGGKNYRFEPVSLAEVVESAGQTMRHPLEQQGFQLLIDSGSEAATVRADRDALEQAVLNLLANAMKYSGDAREIALRLRRENGCAVIQVEDHGVGIAPEEHQHIFERFYRAPTRENQLIPGAGLGLTLVQHIAQAHGGGVALESAPGKGSTFSIRIPVEAQE